MNYKDYISQIEELQKGKNRVMYLILINLIVGIGKQTEIEDFKIELREIYKTVKLLPNPINLRNGAIVNQKAWETINELMIKMIDLLNDYYGNYKFIQQKKL